MQHCHCHKPSTAILILWARHTNLAVVLSQSRSRFSVRTLYRWIHKAEVINDRLFSKILILWDYHHLRNLVKKSHSGWKSLRVDHSDSDTQEQFQGFYPQGILLMKCGAGEDEVLYRYHINPKPRSRQSQILVASARGYIMILSTLIWSSLYIIIINSLCMG